MRAEPHGSARRLARASFGGNALIGLLRALAVKQRHAHLRLRLRRGLGAPHVGGDRAQYELAAARDRLQPSWRCRSLRPVTWVFNAEGIGRLRCSRYKHRPMPGRQLQGQPPRFDPRDAARRLPVNCTFASADRVACSRPPARRPGQFTQSFVRAFVRVNHLAVMQGSRVSGLLALASTRTVRHPIIESHKGRLRSDWEPACRCCRGKQRQRQWIAAAVAPAQESLDELLHRVLQADRPPRPRGVGGAGMRRIGP